MISTVRDVTDRKQLEQGIRKLSRAVEQSPASVMITDLDGNIRYVNPKFEAATGYTSAEVVGRNPRFLKSGHTSTNEYADLWQTISKGETWTGELQNKRKDGTVFWERASIGAVFNENGEIMEYLAVKEDITELKEALDTLEQRVMERTHSLHLATDELSTSNQEIMESIRYAQRIQMAILPSENELKSVITQCFVLFEPRNIVSGDFYWCHDTGKRAFLAMGDCTGHGVPGALLSVIGMELLDKIVIESGVSEPGKVLASLDAAVQRLLKRHDTDVVMNDGMDIAFVCFDHDDSTLHYANAQSFGLLVSKDVCTELEPQKLSIGGHTSQADKVFVTRQLALCQRRPPVSLLGWLLRPVRRTAWQEIHAQESTFAHHGAARPVHAPAAGGSPAVLRGLDGQRVSGGRCDHHRHRALIGATGCSLRYAAGQSRVVAPMTTFFSFRRYKRGVKPLKPNTMRRKEASMKQVNVSWILSSLVMLSLTAGLNALEVIDIPFGVRSSIGLPTVLYITGLFGANFLMHLAFYYGGFVNAPLKRGLALGMVFGVLFFLANVLFTTTYDLTNESMSVLVVGLAAKLAEYTIGGVAMSVLSVTRVHQWGFLRYV
jgi:PAS domain S-box-containing protein